MSCPFKSCKSYSSNCSPFFTIQYFYPHPFSKLPFVFPLKVNSSLTPKVTISTPKTVALSSKFTASKVQSIVAS